MHEHAFSMYIPAGMLNCIQEKVSVMSQLTTQLHFQSLCPYALWQLHDNVVALTSLLHHHTLYKKLSDITEHAPETDA